MRKCRYWETCKYYRQNSYTCNYGNKNHCGQFRFKEREREFKEKYKRVKQ